MDSLVKALPIDVRKHIYKYSVAVLNHKRMCDFNDKMDKLEEVKNAFRANNYPVSVQFVERLIEFEMDTSRGRKPSDDVLRYLVSRRRWWHFSRSLLSIALFHGVDNIEYFKELHPDVMKRMKRVV